MDLEAVAQAGIYGISVGKINSEKDIMLISEAIEEQESKKGIRIYVRIPIAKERQT